MCSSDRLGTRPGRPAWTLTEMVGTAAREYGRLGFCSPAHRYHQVMLSLGAPGPLLAASLVRGMFRDTRPNGPGIANKGLDLLAHESVNDTLTGANRAWRSVDDRAWKMAGTGARGAL
jgi:hypothetical protein